MSKQTRSFRRRGDGSIKPPAYPFSGPKLFGHLRHRLAEDLREKMTLARLSEIMGAPISTTHYWFEICPHPHVLGFMSLLERLSPPLRHSFIDEHCRVYPRLGHPRLTDTPARASRLFELLKKRTGLTLITGGPDTARTFLITALAHSFPALDAKQRSAAGIDLHSPRTFVPAGGLFYFDEAQGVEALRQATKNIWPRVITTRAPLVLFNRIWSSVTEVRDDIIRLAQHKHVILADEELPGTADLKKVQKTVHWLRVSMDKRGSGIRVSCRRRKNRSS